MSTTITHPRRRVDPSLAEADVLAVRCRIALEQVAHRGGPDVVSHLDQLRRHLMRSAGGRGRGWSRRRVERTVHAAATGHAGSVPAGEVVGLVHDLRVLERALAGAVRVGAGGVPVGPAT